MAKQSPIMHETGKFTLVHINCLNFILRKKARKKERKKEKEREISVIKYFIGTIWHNNYTCVNLALLLLVNDYDSLPFYNMGADIKMLWIASPLRGIACVAGCPPGKPGKPPTHVHRQRNRPPPQV